MQVPNGITNLPGWEENCRKIHARAKDLIAGKIGIFEAARILQKLAIWTKNERDPDFEVFIQLMHDAIGLPIGKEREYWAAQALDREEPRIRAVEEKWTTEALASAHRLVERFSWALAARRHRRQSGHST